MPQLLTGWSGALGENACRTSRFAPLKAGSPRTRADAPPGRLRGLGWWGARLTKERRDNLSVPQSEAGRKQIHWVCVGRVQYRTGGNVDNLTKANHYRDQAANLRHLAELDDHAETREGLLSIARSYDRLYVRYLGLSQAAKVES